ncbi:sigma-54-dependent transcriptional regulator [Marinicella rhabdoformis]|uniref:sigma-54-dependent transcriptional regulator n=1 Tax=Marinicella rhabdoformis TaxID=2580566 RepID=UPI0012AEB5F1|nr:sigma-54 dependent transcriptional regulator [Marinicella rhabdoformis]
MSKSHILIIDDEPDIRSLISDILSDEGYQVSTAENGATAQQQLSEFTPDLVLLDIWMPDVDGISLLKGWHDAGSLQFPVVMMSGHGTIETAIEATKMGAKDFVEKPISLAKLLQTIEQTLSSYAKDLSIKADNPWQFYEPIGNSEHSKQLRSHIDKLAKNNNNTVFVGDSGTGKLTLAMLLHSRRNANQQAAAVIDALQLKAEDAEAQLIQMGNQLLSLNQNVSLIISNIDCLTQELQQQLLACVKQWSSPELALLTTTQQDIKALVNSGEFSRELYDHLAEITIVVSSLSERSDDVPELLNFYVNHLPDHEQTPYRKMSFAAQNHLRNYTWPGNIRELKNLVRQLQLLGGEGDIELDEVTDLLEAEHAQQHAHGNTWYDLDLREAREAFERDYLMHHLEKVEGKVGDLAKIVGMERTHLYRKLRALDINPKAATQS